MKKLLLFLLATTAYGQQPSIICSTNVKEYSDWADIIFVGEVVWFTHINDGASGERTVVTFRTTEYWKGDLSKESNWKGEKAKEIRIYTFVPSRGYGGYRFRDKDGERYLIFAKKSQATDWLNFGRGKVALYPLSVLLPEPKDLVYGVSPCTARPLGEASDFLKILGEPKVIQ